MLLSDIMVQSVSQSFPIRWPWSVLKVNGVRPAFLEDSLETSLVLSPSESIILRLFRWETRADYSDFVLRKN